MYRKSYFKDNRPNSLCIDRYITHLKEVIIKTLNSQYCVTITETQWKIVFDTIYSCSMSSMHTLFSASSGWPCYNLTSLNMLFNITCTTFLMGCQSCVVSFIFAQVFYNHLHRLVNKVWASDKIIYIPIRFNTQIENRVKPSLCSSFEVFNH